METLYILILMVATNVTLWIGSNSQFFLSGKSAVLTICALSGIISTFLSYYTNQIGYGKFTMWELRMLAFTASYVTFPFFTWKFFGEGINNPKTVVSIALSIAIMLVQIFWK
jgi:hypothetical protein